MSYLAKCILAPPPIFRGKEGKTERGKVQKEEKKMACEGNENMPGWVPQGKRDKTYFTCFHKLYKVNAKSKIFLWLMVLFSEILVERLSEHRKLLPGKKREGKLSFNFHQIARLSPYT